MINNEERDNIESLKSFTLTETTTFRNDIDIGTRVQFWSITIVYTQF